VLVQKEALHLMEGSFSDRSCIYVLGVGKILRGQFEGRTLD
jgi:hypothetical protein